MVELRKRKIPQGEPPPLPKKKSKAVPEPKPDQKATTEESQPMPAEKPAVGQIIALDGFGGELETNDGEKTTLEKLVGSCSDEGKKGVVIFTYPKASTPGCMLHIEIDVYISADFHQVQSKPASSATITINWPLTVSPCMACPPILPSPTPPSRPSSTCSIPSSATPAPL